jgi:hypothetical protein
MMEYVNCVDVDNNWKSKVFLDIASWHKLGELFINFSCFFFLTVPGVSYGIELL